jgi:hypothetical protein
MWVVRCTVCGQLPTQHNDVVHSIALPYQRNRKLLARSAIQSHLQYERVRSKPVIAGPLCLKTTSFLGCHRLHPCHPLIPCISCFHRHPTTTTQLAHDERVVALAEGCVPAQRREGSREVCESPHSLDLRCLKRMPCSGPTPECPHLHTHSPHHLCRLDPTRTCRGRVHSRTLNVNRGKALHFVRSLPVGHKCLFKAANLWNETDA